MGTNPIKICASCGEPFPEGANCCPECAAGSNKGQMGIGCVITAVIVLLVLIATFSSCALQSSARADRSLVDAFGAAIGWGAAAFALIGLVVLLVNVANRRT
jgi:hypothetical protein